MPSYDLSRERFRLSELHVTALLASLASDSEDLRPEELSAATEELREIGLIDPTGSVVEPVRPLLLALDAPVMQVHIETLSAHGVCTHGATLSSDTAFTREEWPGTGEWEFARFEPATLVFEIARLMNLRSRPTTTTAVRSIRTTVGAMDAGLAALSGEGPYRADSPVPDEELPLRVRDALAESSELSDSERTVFGDLLASLRCTWRVTSVLPAVAADGTPLPDCTDKAAYVSAGTRVRGFNVWDCGSLGYWYRTEPAEPVLEGEAGPDAALCVEPVTPAFLWERVGELLPD